MKRESAKGFPMEPGSLSGQLLHTFNDLITIDCHFDDWEETKFIFGMDCTQL